MPPTLRAVTREETMKVAGLTSDREGATPAKRSSSYSLLIVTPEGKVMRKRRILARDDAEAAQCAKALRCEWNLELWKGSTLIGEFPALP